MLNFDHPNAMLFLTAALWVLDHIQAVVFVLAVLMLVGVAMMVMRAIRKKTEARQLANQPLFRSSREQLEIGHLRTVYQPKQYRRGWVHGPRP